jgi:hypothetical protein
MEAEGTSETSTNFYDNTRRNIPADSHLHGSRLENLKSHLYFFHFFSLTTQFALSGTVDALER